MAGLKPARLIHMLLTQQDIVTRPIESPLSESERVVTRVIDAPRNRTAYYPTEEIYLAAGENCEDPSSGDSTTGELNVLIA